ncbi:MAG TPA: hypothetical protein VE996_04655 [Terriglobales bacterium]|jgi:hypothetical protein|nr:hypothetical protein [Terriglobales bacterium]
MTEAECRERIRLAAAHAGLQTYFLLPGQIEGTAAVSAVFTVEDYDSDLAQFDPATVNDAEIRKAVEQARQVLAARSGCEIVHAGGGVFRCLRHDVECETGEEQDPVIRQTLRWTAACPAGDVTQTFYLPPRPASS